MKGASRRGYSSCSAAWVTLQYHHPNTNWELDGQRVLYSFIWHIFTRQLPVYFTLLHLALLHFTNVVVFCFVCMFQFFTFSLNPSPSIPPLSCQPALYPYMSEIIWYWSFSVVFLFYKLKARPCTSKRVMTHFNRSGLEVGPQYLWGVPTLCVRPCDRSDPGIQFLFL